MPEQETNWRNRIVDHGDEAPEQLLANPRNWRIHPKAQQDALGEILDRVGWVQDVIVNRRTGFVVDGHARVAIAISRGEAAVPVVYVDLSEEEEALVLASLDPMSAMAITDKELLMELLGDVDADGALGSMLEALSSGRPSFEDRMAEWTGMPEFTQENQAAWRSLVVHFASAEDMEAFGKLMEQPLTPKTKSIWFPEAAIGRYANLRYAAEDES